MKYFISRITILIIALLLSNFVLNAKDLKISSQEMLKHADRSGGVFNSSPVRRIKRDLNKKKQKNSTYSIRTIDGSNNNILNPNMNSHNTRLLRITTSSYDDGVSSLAGATRPNPRVISNTVLTQSELTQTPNVASDYLWQWGQFIDHDLDLTDGAIPTESANIPIPAGDSYFDPGNTGDVVLPFNRSIYEVSSGTGTDNPREQLNEITGWFDASNVYGSDEARALALRTLDGTGKLKTSKDNLLPFNTEGLSNAGGPSDSLFLAGDVRANEQVGLTAMHTLFVREHNRLAEKIAKKHPNFSDEKIYQGARRIVAAQIQVITYNEFLPVLLGQNKLSRYKGYQPDIDSSISNEFATAAFRLGHSLLSPQILRLNKRNKEIKYGHLALRDAFFGPKRIIDEGGIDPLLRGLAKQPCQNLDIFIIDDVRNFLFGQPGEGGFDLASLNIQRGRDHGLPHYNEVRRLLGLQPVTSFAEISSNLDVQSKLSEAYSSVDEIDLWVGGLAEDNVHDALVGEVFYIILKDQFERLRDGDRFWYKNIMSDKEIRKIEKTTLAKIIRRNTKIKNEIQNNVFLIN